MHSSSHLLSSLAPEFLSDSLLEFQSLLVKYFFCSLILFLSEVNHISEFSHNGLNFFMTVTLNFPSDRWQFSGTLNLVSGKLSFSFCETMLLWFFIVFDELFLCWHIWSSEHLSHLDFVYFNSNNSKGWSLQAFLLYFSRWCYSTSFCFLLPEPPLAKFESLHYPPSTTSAKVVTGTLIVAYASRVTGALLLLAPMLSLALLLGALGWQVSPLLLGLPGSWDFPLLLPSSLWLWVPLWPGGQSQVCCLPCCYRFSGAAAQPLRLEEVGGWMGDRIASTASSVPPVLPPLCVQIHPPSKVKMCGSLQCPSVLGRETFVELWIFY